MKKAVVALIIKDGFILGITRRHNKSIYGLIGGKVDPHETLDQALLREVKEETNINLLKYTLIYEKLEPGDGPNSVDYYSCCYYANDWEGDPISSEEGDLAWLTIEEITSTKAAFPDYNKNTILKFLELYPNVLLK